MGKATLHLQLKVSSYHLKSLLQEWEVDLREVRMKSERLIGPEYIVCIMKLSKN